MRREKCSSRGAKKRKRKEKYDRGLRVKRRTVSEKEKKTERERDVTESNVSSSDFTVY